jgi:phosphoribosyl 1,2-cyclic phosphodiesterase
MTEQKQPFSLKFWGVRGSLAVSGPETFAYGGNTSCIEVRYGNKSIILDGGSGLQRLGHILSQGEQREFDLFLTHTHSDHICGLPFFGPMFHSSGVLRIWAGHLDGNSAQSDIELLISPPLFPVTAEQFPGRFEYVGFRAGEELRVDNSGLRIRTCKLNHPGGGTGYRLDFSGRSLCYITDTEHTEGQLDENILELIQGSDLMVYDTCFTEKEFRTRNGWGHSTWQEGVRLCEAAGVGRLVGFHHELRRREDELNELDVSLGNARPGSFYAREGMTVEL